MAAHLPDLLEAELAAEPERLLEAERVRRAARLLEELLVDGHPDVRRTPRARLAQCMAAEHDRFTSLLPRSLHGTVRNPARHGNVHASPAARRACRPVSDRLCRRAEPCA